jgi:H+/Cl- antiporter ClcA
VALRALGQSIKAGNNLVIDTLHDEGPELPLRMAPMVLVGTVLTHLFGGSAGREGTAVQMGASLADWVSHRLRGKRVRRQLLAAGVAGGFGSVFGTPIAGAVFGLEVVVLGRLEYDALVPALVASVVGRHDHARAGHRHTPYPAAPHVPLTPLMLVKWLVFAAAMALVAVFIELTHLLKKRGERHVPRLPPAHVPRRLGGGGAVEARGHERLPRPRRAHDRARVRRSEPARLRLRAQAPLHRDHARRGLLWAAR